jgi:UDP-galactopyranose mutase
MTYDYLIVGAGLFGCVCAHELHSAGKTCKVIDRRSHIAGNIYTEKQNGIQVHRYGAHIFHTSDREVWEYVNEYAEFNNYINSPIARYHNELYNLPFNMNTFSKMWGVVTPDEAKAVIAKQVQEAGITNPQNLEEQALSLAGRDIYEKLIKEYTQKQWGRPCTELPAFIIKRLPFRFVYDNNYFNDRYQGIPVGGYTQIAEKLLADVPVELNKDFLTSASEIQIENQSYYEMDGDLFRNVIYTGMIDAFFHYQYGPLEYRSLKFETEVLPDCDNYQGNAVVNYTSADVPFTRIIEHKHFEFGKDSETREPIHGTIITREYPRLLAEGHGALLPPSTTRRTRLCTQSTKRLPRRRRT